MAIVDKYISHITPLDSPDTYKIKAYLLKNGRTFKVKLDSANASTAFDGSANITDIGVSGILGTVNGGTGNDSFTKDTLIYANTDTKLASYTSTKGGTKKLWYLNAGVPTDSTETVGATDKPVFLSSGTITESTSNIGSEIIPIYMASGQIKASTSTVGDGEWPVYLNSGTIAKTTYYLKSNIESGTQNRAAYYSSARKIEDAGSIYIDASHITINGTAAPANSGEFQVIGTSTMRTILPETDSTYAIGKKDSHWAIGWFDKLQISNDINYEGNNDSSNSGSGERGIFISGYGIEMYRDMPYIDFHRNKTTTNFTSRIIDDESTGLRFEGTATTTAVSVNLLRSAQKPEFRFNGETFINGVLDVSSTTNLTNNVYISSTSTNRARLYIQSHADVPNDLYLGNNNVDQWSITSRDSAGNFNLMMWSCGTNGLNTSAATFNHSTGNFSTYGTIITNHSVKTKYNDGKAGAYIGIDGTIHLTHATGEAYIGLHRTGNEGVTGWIQTATTAAVSIGGTAGSRTYYERTIAPEVNLDGVTYINGLAESPSGFVNNVNTKNGGFLLYGKNALYGRLYIDTEGTEDAIGYTRLILGNSTPSGTAKNSRGRLEIYGSNEYRVMLYTHNQDANRDIYLPKVETTAYLMATYALSGDQDLNTKYDAGIYSITGGKVTHYPDGASAYANLLVIPYRKPYANTTPDYAFQIYSHSSYNRLWFRGSTASAYSAWQEAVHVGANDGAGGVEQPVYVDVTGVVKDTDYYLKASIESGVKNRAAYYSDVRKIEDAGSIYMDASHIGINGTNTSYNFYVNGTSYFNGNTTHNGIDYFANGTTYYINNSGTGNLNALTVNNTTASTTTGTGGLIVKGGAGIAGRVTASEFNATRSMIINAGKVYSNISGSNVILPAKTTMLFADGIAIANPGLTAANDVGWLRVTGTAETDMALELATGDDGGAGETIHVRQYNTSNTIVNDLTLLDTKGNTLIPNSLRVNKGISKTEAQNKTHIISPGGGSYATSTSTVTGALKIQLPVSWTSCMLNFSVDIYDYAVSRLVTYHIGGYNYNPSSNKRWASTSAYSNGTGDKSNLTVRFGHDGTHCCVIIGETDTSWSYPQVNVRDVYLGYSDQTIENWETGWAISFITTLPTITGTTITSPNRVLDGTANRLAYYSAVGTISQTGSNLHTDGSNLYATGGHDFITAGNEFNFISDGFSSHLWFNYETVTRKNNGNVTAYIFGNGKHGELARITSGQFSGNAATATMPLGFTGRNTNATWGNQVGATVTSWNGPGGCSVDWRQNNPQTGQLSMKVDGTVYINEGEYPVLAQKNANGYPGFLITANTTNHSTSAYGSGWNDTGWLRTTSNGFIPYEAGGVGNGHSSLGTSSWYFKTAYIDTINGNNLYINAVGSDHGIYSVGTKATYRMIRFIDNTEDKYGNGIVIGGGGLTILGSGESGDTLYSNLGYTGGSEITVIGSDGEIAFYPGNGSYDASAKLTMTASRFWAGVNGNTAREAQVGVQSGAGQLYMYSAASTTGDKGIYFAAHGDSPAGYIAHVDSAHRVYYNSNFTSQRVKLIANQGSQINSGVWLRTCIVQSYQNYANFQIRLTGNWSTGSPTVATIDVNMRNGLASMKLVHRGFLGVIGKVKLVKLETNTAYLDVYIRDASKNTDYFGQFIGNVTVTQNNNTTHGTTNVTTTDVNGLATLDLTAGVGNDSTPVYIDATGNPVACTAYSSATNIRAATVNINNDTTSKLFVLGATTTGYTSIYRESSVYMQNNVLYGAAWNDYAEFRQLKENKKIEPGRVVYENGDDTLSMSNERLMRGCSIVSDTYGFGIGESEEAQLPIAVSGRVLAYPYEDKEEFKNHIGWPVCSGPNGTVSIMTEKEEMKYPSRIIGTISAIPDYEIWHGGADVVVDGRVWIKVR